jgi:hypothetical protein
MRRDIEGPAMPSELIADALGVADHGHTAPEWWTPRETSAYIRVAEKTLANWRSSGYGPTFTKRSPGRGGRILYRRSDVEDWMNNRNAAVA